MAPRTHNSPRRLKLTGFDIISAKDKNRGAMRERRYMNALPLLALGSMAALTPAAFAQQPRPAVSSGAAGSTQQYTPSGQAASQSGEAQGGGMVLKLMDLDISVRPSVKLDVQHNDNIYSTPNNKTGDQILVLTPALTLMTKQGTNSFSLRMSSAIGQYQNHASDNYTNNSINGLADFDLGTRLRANLRGDYIDGVDPRGSTNNPLSSTPDRYRHTYGQGIVSYGASGAQGRVDIELGRLQRDYLNNRATTAGSDRLVDDIGATFRWRLGPKTELIFQGKHSDVKYSLASSTLGSVENMFLAGATWEASAKTTGTFRFGMVKKDFDDSTRGNSTALSWSGDVRWSPLTYSHVNLTLNRAPAETTGGVGNFIDRTATSVRWTHSWSSRLTSEALASYMTDAYQGADRTDNTQKLGLKATYKMRRWLDFGADYALTARSSSNNNFDFKSNVFMLFLNAAL